MSCHSVIGLSRMAAMLAFAGWATTVAAQSPPPVLPVADQLFQPVRKVELDPVAAFRSQNPKPNESIASLVSRLEESDSTGLDQADAAGLARRLRELARRLDERQSTRISRLVLARSVDPRGNCELWPAGHAYRPGRGDEPGDRMLALVEVEHLKFQFREGSEECSFSVRTELRDRLSVRQTMSFPAKAVRKADEANRQWLTLCFHLPPRLSPGQHSLSVEIEQSDGNVTTKTRKSVEFLVGIGRDEPPPETSRAPRTGTGGPSE